MIDFVAPAPSVTFAAPASVFEYVAPAPVLEFIAPTPAVSFVAPSQQLRPAYTAAAVTSGVNLDAEFVGSASQVVGSLPHGEVFAAPVFHQVHQEQLAGGEIPENLVEIPVVQKQVILGVRPDPLAEPRHWFIPGLEALCPDDDGAPSLSLPSLADRTAEVVDSSSLRFLTASALEARRKEERKKEKEKQKAATAKELVVVPGVGEWVELVDEYGRTYFFNPQLGATRWSLPGSSSSSSTPKRKKKKRRRKPRPRRRTVRTR